MNLFAPIHRRAIVGFAVAAAVAFAHTPAIASGGRITFVGSIVNPTCGPVQVAERDRSPTLCTANDGAPVGGHVTTTAVTGTESKLIAYFAQWAEGSPQMMVVTYD